MQSDPKLKRWYRAFNLQYFGGELPDNVEVWWEPCGRNAADTGVVDIAPPGHPPELVIRIDPMFIGSPRHAKIDLIHEMRHVKLWPYRGLEDHGKRFDEETKRLCGHRSYRNLL